MFILPGSYFQAVAYLVHDHTSKTMPPLSISAIIWCLVAISSAASTANNGKLPTLSFERRWKTKLGTEQGFGSISMQVSEDTVYVLNGAGTRNEIVLYDLEGKFVKKYPGWFNWPMDLALGGGNPSSVQPLVSAIGAMDDGGQLHFGMVLYNQSGSFFHGFMEEQTGLKRPYGLATSPSGGQVIVADWNANRTVILDVGWVDGTISASSDPVIPVPYPFRVAVSVGPGSKNSSVIHRYIVSSEVCCEPWHEGLRRVSIFDGSKKLIKVVKDLPTGERLKAPNEVSSDPSGNILVVDAHIDVMKTHFLDNDGNYIGVIEELGAPSKIVFHENKVYTLTEDKDHNDYVNVFGYSN